MNIAFDGTTLTPQQTGVGYYTEHLLHHLVVEAPEDHFTVVSNDKLTTSLSLPDRVRVFERYRFPVRHVWMQLVAPLLLAQLRIQVAHFTNGFIPLIQRIPTVVTIHDMTLRQFPHLHPPRRRLTRALVEVAARKADAVVTVSESARQDILRITGIPADKVHVIAEAAAPAFLPIDDHNKLSTVRKRYGLPERFVLFVGTIEPRKNLPRLIQAYGKLRAAGGLPHKLVCVGPYGWGYQAVRRMVEDLGLQDDVLLTGYVPFQDLAAIYNLSEIFVFPSLYEGFGLPVLEAMACGIPVITAANSSLTEVAGECAELVDPGKIDSIAEALHRLAAQPERRKELSALGLSRIGRFSWKRAARATLGVYRKVAG